MKTLQKLFALIAIMLTTGCVTEEKFGDTPDGNLQALWTIIDEHYCFLDYKQQHLGMDWNEVRQRYVSKLNPEMTRMQLFEICKQMLSELQDGHVNLYTSADQARYWSWYEDYPKNLDTELREQYLGTDYRIASSLRYKVLPDNIGYILCESFASGFGEGNLDDIFYYLRACNGLILDVRGNGGGDLTYAERLARRFTNEKILVGYFSHKTGRGHNDFSKPQAEYLEPSTGVRWQKRCIVLTNRECYSACNAFIRDMKQCPQVTVLGDQTGGGSGMPMSSELPNGWSVRFSACPMYDAQMQQIEFGIAPDIPCALDSVDAANGYDTLIETARKMMQ